MSRWKLFFCTFFLLGAVLSGETFFERNESLNKDLLEALEKEANGERELRVAELFSEMNKPSWAVLYYRKALLYFPRNQALREALQNEENKLFKREYAETFAWTTKGEWLTLFAISLLILTVSFLFFRRAYIYFLFLVSLTFLAGAFYKQYASPVEVVAIEPMWLFQKPLDQAPLASSEPLYPGTTAHVLGSYEGKWLQVVTKEGVVAYVRGKGVRSVE